MINSVLLD